MVWTVTSICYAACRQLCGLLKTTCIQRDPAGCGAAQNDETDFNSDKNDPLIPSGQRTAAHPQVCGDQMNHRVWLVF